MEGGGGGIAEGGQEGGGIGRGTWSGSLCIKGQFVCFFDLLLG